MKTGQRAIEFLRRDYGVSLGDSERECYLHGLSASTTADAKRPRSYVSQLFARQCKEARHRTVL